MLGIQLRRKRTGLVPIGGVRNLDRSRTLNPPRLLVQLFDKQFLRIRKGLHLLHVAAKVADLVKRIPRGHSHGDFTGHVGNGHRHVEEMPLRMIQKDGVLNCRLCSSAEC